MGIHDPLHRHKVPALSRTALALSALGLGVGALSLAGGAANAARQTAPVRVIAPMEAILLAAERPQQGVTGVFEIQVLATGRSSGRIHLNSQRDYRDQRNLSVTLAPQVIPVLAERLGGAPDKVLAGKTIRVIGIARRVKIAFVSNGRPSDKYYYQTRVTVMRDDQIEIVG